MSDEIEHLRAFLADRDAACPCCGYNLRGAATDVCPECAHRVAIGLILTDPLGKSWVSGLIALALGAGFFDVSAVFVVVMSLAYEDWPPTIINVAVFPAAALLSAGLILWLARRRAFMRQVRAKQARGAALCWVLVGICLLLLAVAFVKETR